MGHTFTDEITFYKFRLLVSRSVLFSQTGRTMSIAQRVTASASYGQQIVNKLKVLLDMNPAAQKYIAALSSVGKSGSGSSGQSGHTSIDKNGVS